MPRNVLFPAIALILAAFLVYRQETGKPLLPGLPDYGKKRFEASTPVDASGISTSTAAVPGPDPFALPAKPVGPQAKPADVPPPPNEGRVRFFGVIYDLETLEAVAGAQVTMAAPAMNGLKLATFADGAGHYRIDMPTGQKLYLQAAAPNFRTGQLADTDPPMSALPPPVRKRRAEETGISDLAPYSPQIKPGQALIRLDLVMVQQKPGQTMQFIELPQTESTGGAQVFLPAHAKPSAPNPMMLPPGLSSNSDIKPKPSKKK